MAIFTAVMVMFMVMIMAMVMDVVVVMVIGVYGCGVFYAMSGLLVGDRSNGT